jgi:SAM-dependent methyltransferase
MLLRRNMAPVSPKPLVTLSQEELEKIRRETVAHYDSSAEAFWQGTRDHDVSQNIEVLLRHLASPPPCTILDLGCGPGRDLRTFRARGHHPVGLDGAPSFVRMAREYANCEVLEQDLLALDLPAARFDGIFANAVLFHVPSQELPRVLRELHAALRAEGVLFCSNPRGLDRETWNGRRYGAFLSWPTWRAYVTEAGFEAIEHFYRPAGKPRAQQPWLASVWRKT